jgi:DNA-binding response OmpR family regulator
MRILIVEDDETLGRSLAEDVRKAGFSVDLATEGRDAEYRGSTENYDLIVLDLGLPGLSGLEILERWRTLGNQVPVIILTARSAWHERVDGFKAGADDYLGKPFHREELLARIQAIIKRVHGRSPGCLKVQDLELDEDRQEISIEGGAAIELSGTEFRMIRAFMLHPGQVLSKTHLSEHLFNADAEPDSNIIEVYITRLRQKIGHTRIQTRRGQGYVLTDPR